ELAAARDHIVEVEAALLVELDDARHVDAETVRAHEASLDALLVEQRKAVDVDFLADGDHPDNRGEAAVGERLVGLLGRNLEADRFEGILDAVASERANLGDRIALGRIDGVSGAEFFRELELGGKLVDRDDHAGASDARALDDREANAA